MSVSGERGDVETQHRLRVAAAGDRLRDGVERNRVGHRDDTRLLAVGVIPDEQRVGFDDDGSVAPIAIESTLNSAYV